MNRTFTKLFGLVTLLLLSNLAFGQGNLYWQNPLPQGNDVNDVQFIDSQTGFAVCPGGIVMKTTDGGATWSLKDLSTATSWVFTKVFFLNNQVGWIAGYLSTTGLLFKTTDGGNTWNRFSSSALTTLMSVYFRSATLGWTVAQDGKVAKTTDGGATWVNKFSGVGSTLYSVYFTSDQVGFIMGSSGFIRKSTDEGETWAEVTSPVNSIKKARFLSSTIGFACGTGTVAKTTDGGNTWVAQTTPSTTASYVDIFFVNENIGYLLRDAATSSASVYKTTDGGTTWTKPYTTSPTLQALCFWFFNENKGLTFGKKGRMSWTTDGGINWTPNILESNSQIRDIFFLNENLGWCVAFDNGGSFVGKTTNGGKSWKISVNALTKPWSVFFVNENYGWISCDGGGMAKTTDGGTTWTTMTVNSYGDHMYDVFFVDTLYGWTVGSNYFHRTTDGGATWTQTLGGAANSGGNSIWFLDRNRGMKDSYQNNYTSDGGVTWSNMPGYTLQQSKFIFATDKIGWAVQNTDIAKTTDGGLTWTAKYLTNVFLRAVACTDTSVLWAAGNGGLLYKSTDGGTAWTKISSLAGVDLYAIFARGSNIWYGGMNGAIISNIAPLTAIEDREYANTNPSRIDLAQNYPNPFNPATTIRFSLTENAVVSLKVFDLLGKEIAVLINAEYKAGTHKAEWDATRYTSGVYFYQLTTNGKTITKKLALLK